MKIPGRRINAAGLDKVPIKTDLETLNWSLEHWNRPRCLDWQTEVASEIRTIMNVMNFSRHTGKLFFLIVCVWESEKGVTY